MSENPAVKKAIQWISAQKKMDPDKNFSQLINEAILKFDLSPKDSEFLYSFYRKGENGDEAKDSS